MDKILFNQPRDRTTPLLRKFTEDERKRRRSFERKDNSVPLAGSVKYIAPGTSWSVQFHFREKGKVVNFSCFGREFMENLCLLMNIPLNNLYQCVLFTTLGILRILAGRKIWWPNLFWDLFSLSRACLCCQFSDKTRKSKTHEDIQKNIEIITKAASHKLPGKSSSNVSFVLSCPVLSCLISYNLQQGSWR